MKDTNLMILIGVVIALVVIATLSIKGCSEKNNGVNSEFVQRQIDSVKREKEAAERMYQVLLKNNAKAVAEKDSLSRISTETAKKLEIQSLKVKVLVREAQLARESGSEPSDNTNYIAACDSLIPHIDSLITLADQSRENNRLLQNSYDSLLSTNSLYESRLEFERDFYKEKFDTLSTYALALEKSKTVSDKKAKKRLGIGPSIGATYYQEKIRPFAGVSIQWHIIRF